MRSKSVVELVRVRALVRRAIMSGLAQTAVWAAEPEPSFPA